MSYAEQCAAFTPSSKFQSPSSGEKSGGSSMQGSASPNGILVHRPRVGVSQPTLGTPPVAVQPRCCWKFCGTMNLAIPEPLPQPVPMTKGKLAMVAGSAAVVLCAVPTIGIVSYIAKSTGDSRERAEYEHRVVLPPSASKIQCRGDGWLRVTPISGGCVTTMFEMDPSEVSAFLAPLHIRSRNGPATATGDPLVNGWNVWPNGSATFIPGNEEYGGWRPQIFINVFC